MTPVLEAFSAALLHFAWQGCVVLALLWVALFALRKRSANARYTAGCAALAVLAAAPLVTTYALYQRPAAGRPQAAAAAALPAPTGGAAQASPGRETRLLAAAQSWALPFWAFGVLVFSLRMVWGCAQVSALQRRGEAGGDEVLAMVAKLSQRMGLARHARVLISAWAGGPSLVGWLRPVILLPAAALSGLTPQQLEAVLAHELAHIRRHDYLVNWMQMLVETLLFYHPAVWWISSRVRHERELCCDDLAVSACEGALCYARALTTLERMRAAAPLTALGSTDGALFYRIQRIVGAATQQYGPSRASVVVALSLAVAGLVFSVNWARGQSQPAQDYLVQGDVLLGAGANDLALQKYLAGLAADPGNRVIYQKRCIETYVRMGRKAEAVEVNAQLLKEHPDDTDALSFGASILLDQGDAAAAAAQLKQLLQRAPGNAVAHLTLGLAYAAQSDVEGARREIQEAIRLRPDFIRARQALERLNEGANLPGALSFNAATGDVQATLGGTTQSDAVRRRYDEALTTLQSESEKHPERLDLMQQLGNAAGRAGKYDLAIYTYQRLLDRMDQGSEARGEIYLRLGETYRRKGDAGGAIQALEKATELIPGNRVVFANLELALDAAGRHTEATRMREEAATTQNNQVTLTTNFLREELASAEKLLESLRSQPQPATEALRQVESRVQEIKRKLASAIVVRAASAVTLHLGDMPEAMKQDLLKYLQAREGDTLTGAAAGATLAAAKEYDESLDVRYAVMDDGRVQLVITKPRK